ncbi:MAG: hypothetical protein ACTSWF_08430 [Candidatus Freyarchaeota archaeon]
MVVGKNPEKPRRNTETLKVEKRNQKQEKGETIIRLCSAAEKTLKTRQPHTRRSEHEPQIATPKQSRNPRIIRLIYKESV